MGRVADVPDDHGRTAGADEQVDAGMGGDIVTAVRARRDVVVDDGGRGRIIERNLYGDDPRMERSARGSVRGRPGEGGAAATET